MIYSTNMCATKTMILVAIVIASACADPGIPKKIDINVPCANSTSYCGFNGECKQNGPVYVCKCDSGYSTIDITAPCGAKGESQAKLALLTYFFGWSGATAFMLGWTAWGVSVLMLCCCGSCCVVRGKDNENGGMLLFGWICIIAYCGVWLYLAITISLNNCVDKKGVACKSW
jgi:hypothetical protein